MSAQILIDMDGVLTDFVPHCLKLLGKTMPYDQWPKGEFNLAKVLDITDDELWCKINTAGEEFWDSMPETPWADELISFIRESQLEFIISTSPSNDPHSACGKMKWIQRKFSGRFRNFMIGPCKEAMAKTGVALIDDWDRNLEKFFRHGGHPICCARPWNNGKNDRNPLPHMIAELERFKSLYA